jgi:N-acetylmuramoyl-L-alanine amidase
MANNYKVDMFLSIHTNSGMSPVSEGMEIYYADYSSQQDKPGFSSGKTPQNGNIPWDSAQKEWVSESSLLAEAIRGEAERDFKARIIPAPIFVLKGARMPAALVEISFMSNSGEETMLLKDEALDKTAKVLFEGIHAYSKKGE